ncbi:MAG: NADH-quinone oxidoreductase subunit NuoH [Bdellovibrio sp. CG12_big_fil_rev_8_21_14_0_65_39_13]|nr:MAG: NADH-quinone oxidoreductase subunit NuoH [Bdellovibrio sp. CG22_combo_CG10-13_8_21_14_all_39_27]PIQ60770.1 MAG: NADH-quinone oxidoreductase subunit NuoH [Bdellovibrio sp. CG12_big_fil_rev_8_21_14_0_65_39_13]PIR36393.1 MAG: NADH-quinone oxidoreductase subunit NuoH [Bdellovibrio sp. CG11_big_fil_rev_8_21_14_0_20_39_38]PJB54566.1 MAG: NADH-quinone oxidoreductase subunit NuoH [Bdellovibrio sp. CG_4_9_14_3_um_filter_39_7]
MNSTIVSYLSQFEGYQKFVSMASSFLGSNASGYITFLVFFLGAFVIVNVMALIGGLGTYAERKISADLQMRQGPNRVGPYGILQFLADGVKMIMKEDIIPSASDKFMFTLAPLLALLGVLATFAVIPFSSGLMLSDLNVGVFYLIGVSSLVGVGVFLAGYSSNSKWSMLGGMRGASQIISYEVPVTLSILSIVLLAGGMSFGTLVNAQSGFPHEWFILHNPFTFIGFFVYFIGALAETNRAPFDLPEAESELVSGYHTEYTGMRFAFFALAEYMEVFVVCGVAAALFLGGYKVPFDLGDGAFFTHTLHLPEFIGKNIGQVLELGSFFTKTLVLYYIVIWIRWTLPRLRVDQLMTLCWKYLTPIALFNLVGCAFWMYYFEGKSLYVLLFKSAAHAAGAGH